MPPSVPNCLLIQLRNNFPQIQDEILKQFAKTRTMIRISNNNKMMKNAPPPKRVVKQLHAWMKTCTLRCVS